MEKYHPLCKKLLDEKKHRGKLTLNLTWTEHKDTKMSMAPELDKPTHFGNRIDLDGGAAYGRALTPVVFEGRNCWTLTSKGRQSLEQK